MIKHAKSRGGYMAMIATYEKRREKIRDKFNFHPPKGGHGGKTQACPPGYKEAVKNINRKLDNWRTSIKRIDAYHLKLKQCNRQIYDFMGVGLKGMGPLSSNPKHKNILLARNIFIKYLLEHRMPGPYIEKFLGLNKGRKNGPDGNHVRISRVNFNRSFVTNPQNREMYHRFLQYIKELE